jgi:hypothetical protein
VQDARAPTRRDRVGEEQHVDQTARVLLEVGCGWWTLGHEAGVDEQAFASGLDQPAEGAEARVAPAVLVRRDDWLGRTRTPRQIGLGQATATADTPEQLPRVHGASISDCLCSDQRDPAVGLTVAVTKALIAGH